MPYERVMVFGFTGFRGTMDDGKLIDSGKVLILRPLKSTSNRDDSFKVGQFTQEFPLGSLSLALKHVGDVSKGFAPREMEANFELVSNGKRVEVVVSDLRPIATAKQAA